jgi:hypothetical protein
MKVKNKYFKPIFVLLAIVFLSFLFLFPNAQAAYIAIQGDIQEGYSGYTPPEANPSINVGAFDDFSATSPEAFTIAWDLGGYTIYVPDIHWRGSLDKGYLGCGQ